MWDIDRIPAPPLEFQQKVFAELEEARRRAMQLLEEAGVSVATGFCRNHPDRPCPSRGAFAGLCAECRAKALEERRNGGNPKSHKDDLPSVEKTLRTLLPKAKEIDKKSFELKTKKGVVETIEREVKDMREDFIDTLRELIADWE